MELLRRNVMTLDQALTLGWTLSGSAWSSGYVSRRADPMKQVLHPARGSRAGLWYVDLPAPDKSTGRAAAGVRCRNDRLHETD